MAAKQPSYAEAYDKARQAFARAALADPNAGFPYKRDQALEALRANPDPNTNNHPEHWYTSEEIIEASATYREALQAYLEVQAEGGPAEEVESARLRERQAADELVAARQRHRRGRPIAPVAVAGSPREIEDTRTMWRQLAKQGWPADQIAARFGRPVAEVQGALNELED